MKKKPRKYEEKTLPSKKNERKYWESSNGKFVINNGYYIHKRRQGGRAW